MKKLILSFVLAITFMLVMSVSVMAATPEDLEGWWRFENNALDSSGNNNDGSVNGATLTLGKFGQAYEFDGSDNIEVDDSDTLESEHITLEAWVKSNGPLGNHKYIAGKKYGGGWASYALYTGPSGGLYFYIGYAGGYVRSPDYGIGIWDGEWHHVAGTYDGSSVKLFVDGQEVGTGTPTTVIIDYNYQNFYIGSYGTGYYFNGIIDEVRIWDVALSADEFDMDGDGVLDNVDRCKGIEPDKYERLGTNRFVWNGGEEFDTTLPKEGVGPQKFFSMEDTQGCSCNQILAKMGGKMTGHHKFGCSISVMEDFIAGIQPILVETVQVDADNPNPVESNIVLKSGVEYELEATGTAFAGDTIDFDAKYSLTNRISGDGWTDSVSGYESYGTKLLNLLVDGVEVDWGAYNTEHTYYYGVTGTGTPVKLLIYDIYYPNNVGFITVNIFEKQ